MNILSKLIERMIEHDKGCPERVSHFLKVHGFSKTIAELEGLDNNTQFILETAAIVHDIGIKHSLEKYRSGDGQYQQTEGPPAARRMLEELGFEAPVIERVCYLVSRHHTFTDIDGLDYQILIEADFLVKIFEQCLSQASVQNLNKNIFRTAAGKRFLETIYLNS